MSIALPKNSAKMKDWSWDNYVPFFDYLENLEKLIKYKDAPLSVPNEIPLYIMSKELKKKLHLHK